MSGPIAMGCQPPADWCRQARTRDGVVYRIRPIRAGDAESERAFIAGLSAESRRNRFLYSLREPSPALVDYLVHVDYRSAMAFVAIADTAGPERIIGVARYAADASGSDCEFAVTVADEWQGRGVGTTLARLLFEYARAQGMVRIYGRVFAGNDRMIGLARWLGLELRAAADDPALVEASMRLRPRTANLMAQAQDAVPSRRGP